MAELTNWQKVLVVQKDGKFGAIAAGYEWMIRFNQINSVDFSTFQEDFNLKAKGLGQNSFGSVTAALEASYPHIKIQRKSFEWGHEKVEFIRGLIEKNIPCMISLSVSYKHDVTHEMPVVVCDDRLMRLVWMVGDTNKPDMLRIAHDDTINRHNKCSCGKEIAWLQLL